MNAAIRNSLCLVAPVVLALAGCQAPQAPHHKVGTSTTALDMDSVTIIDRNLMETRHTPFTKKQYAYGKVGIESMGKAPTATGTQEVWVTFSNYTDHPQNLEVRARFYDSNKRPVEEYSAWKRVHLPPKSNDTFKEMSVSNQAAYFYVEAKESD